MNQYCVFSGAFADEMGQRFIRMMGVVGVNTFSELYASTGGAPKKYRECLDRVTAWDPRIVQDELSELRKRYPDVEECFKHVFLAYVKMMRGAANLKLMVSLPRVDNLVMTFCLCLSRHECMRTGRYFSNASVLEQRVVCMDAIRDALFDYLGDDHVKLEDRSVVSEASQVVSARAFRGGRPPSAHANDGSEVAVSRDDASEASSSARRAGPSSRSPAEPPPPPPPPDSHASDAASEPRASNADERWHRAPTPAASRNGTGKPPSEASETSDAAAPRHHDEDERSRVVSNVLEPIASDDDDGESVLGPDDSVSNVDFAAKQHRAMQRYVGRTASAPRDERIDEDESDKSSRTSLSLSSVSINQHGTLVPKASAVHPTTPTSRGKKAASDVGVQPALASQPVNFSSAGHRPPSLRQSASEFMEMTKGYDDDDDGRSERMSETSMRSEPNGARGKASRRRSPARSYVTHLTEDDDD